MISQERHDIILNLLHEKGNVSLQELIKKLHTSESTIRRDLQNLEHTGQLVRVHGGAVLREINAVPEDRVSARRQLSPAEKTRIGRKAASLIGPEDFVYIDAGTTTEAMVEAIEEKEAVYITNSIMHAQILADRGMKVFIPGGQFRALTEAVVGEESNEYLDKYHFTKGFFGTNAVSRDGKLSTMNLAEAMTKKKAMNQCARIYILADTTKFLKQAPITFGDIAGQTVITNAPFDLDGYKQADFILV